MENHREIPQHEADNSAVMISEVRVTQPDTGSETWSKPIGYNGMGGCCSHSTAQPSCRRSTCCLHGDRYLCPLRPQSTPRSTRRQFNFVPQVQTPNTPRIVITSHGDTDECTTPEETFGQDRFMLNADRAPFFIHQLGRVTALKGRQHLYIRGLTPIPVPSKMWTNGILVHLGEDLYLLLQPESAVICVDVPEDGGTFTTSSGRRIYLHPTHGVLRLGRKQLVEGHEIQQVNVETHHDNSVVRRVMAKMAKMAKLENKITRMSDSPKAEWVPPSLETTSGPPLVHTTPNAIATARKGKVLATRCHITVRGWVARPISQVPYVLLPTLAGLCELIFADVMLPRALSVPFRRYAEDTTIKVAVIDGLPTGSMYSMPTFAPYLGQTMELDHLHLLSLIPIHERSLDASEEGKLENSSTTELQSTEDEVSSFPSLKPDAWKRPKEKSRLRQKTSKMFAKTRDGIKAGRAVWRYMI